LPSAEYHLYLSGC